MATAWCCGRWRAIRCSGTAAEWPGYRAMMIGDLDEGVGVVVLMNGPGNARRLGEYVLRALIALRRGHGRHRRSR